MKINILTLGQRVRIVAGKYKGRQADIVKIYFFANHRGAGYRYYVRLRKPIGGRKTFSAHYLEVCPTGKGA